MCYTYTEEKWVETRPFFPTSLSPSRSGSPVAGQGARHRQEPTLVGTIHTSTVTSLANICTRLPSMHISGMWEGGSRDSGAHPGRPGKTANSAQTVVLAGNCFPFPHQYYSQTTQNEITYLRTRCTCWLPAVISSYVRDTTESEVGRATQQLTMVGFLPRRWPQGIDGNEL